MCVTVHLRKDVTCLLMCMYYIHTCMYVCGRHRETWKELQCQLWTSTVYMFMYNVYTCTVCATCNFPPMASCAWYCG